MKRLITNEQEFQYFCDEVRNRKYEIDPIMIDFGDMFFDNSPFDWNKEYLEISRTDKTEIVKRKVAESQFKII